MEFGFFHTARPFTKILLVLFLMVSCYLILFGIGILVSWPAFKVTPSEVIRILERRDTTDHIALLKFLQVLYSAGLFLVPSVLAGFLINKRTWDYLRVNGRFSLTLAVIVILLMLTAIPWINLLGVLNEKLSLPVRWNDLMEQIRQSDMDSMDLMRSYLSVENFPGLLFNLFMIAVIPALGEEFLFRGVLQRIFHEWFGKAHLAVWLAAALFSLAHYQFLGFIPRLVLGALFGYLFLWSGNIWIPVIAHFINNSIGVVYYYLYLQERLGTDPQQLGMQSNPVLFIIGSVLLTGIGIFVIRQIEQERSANAHLP